LGGSTGGNFCACKAAESMSHATIAETAMRDIPNLIPKNYSSKLPTII
jgi:hypothetical protein